MRKYNTLSPFHVAGIVALLLQSKHKTLFGIQSCLRIPKHAQWKYVLHLPHDTTSNCVWTIVVLHLQSFVTGFSKKRFSKVLVVLVVSSISSPKIHGCCYYRNLKHAYEYWSKMVFLKHITNQSDAYAEFTYSSVYNKFMGSILYIINKRNTILNMNSPLHSFYMLP